MTTLKDKLTEAENTKKNNVKSFVWKGAKEIVNGVVNQTEIRLYDATPEQLQGFLNHCYSMLYSSDKVNPGRYTLLDIIEEQREKCNAELYLRYLENLYMTSTERPKYPRFMYLQDVRNSLNLNKEVLPRENWSNVTIDVLTNGIPEEFRSLTIDTVLDACLDTLGQFDKKHITLNFLSKMGLWFTQEDMKSLTEKDENGKNRDRLEVIKERLGLKSTTKLHVDPKGLSFTEFRAMTTLKSKKYSDLTTDQLLTLRNKVLFRLEDIVNEHATSWENRIDQILKVADARNIELVTRG